jgi:asparagine synthase (glutamine-hydrolysing)
MTAIAAAFSIDGPGGDAARLAARRMLDAASHRGTQPATVWSSGPATLGHRASVTGTAAARIPFAANAAGNAIVFDGRLDNRDDLCGILGLDRSSSDAAAALAAHGKWGAGAAAHLLGDFAFAVWDAAARRLVCARDPLGQRPLFYGSIAGATIVASEPQQILAHPRFAAVVNDAMIAEFLTGTPVSVEETIWRGVTRLPAAHTLVVSGTGVRGQRYWDFDPDARLRYARDDEYAEHFLHLFERAIECRTRGAASVGIFLSGGIDSSAVAAMAQQLARPRGAQVRAFSLTFPGQPHDETPYIDAVVRQSGLASVRQAAQAATRQEMTRQIARYRDLPTPPNGSAIEALNHRVSAEVDVALTGGGADEWFGGSPLHTADLLRRGRVLSALRQLRHDAALPSHGHSTADLLRIAVSPLLPRVVRRVLRPLAGGYRPSHGWIRPEFVARVGLRDRIAPVAPRAGPSYVQDDIRAIGRSVDFVLGNEREDRIAVAAGLDLRHPFNDRRLVEFGFALPESQRWYGGETKVVIRRALGSRLPERVRRRTDKAEFSPTFVEALASIGGRAFFARLRSAEEGWVDGTVVQRMYDEMLADYTRGRDSYARLAGALWSVAAVELWMTDPHKEPADDAIDTRETRAGARPAVPDGRREATV